MTGEERESRLAPIVAKVQGAGAKIPVPGWVPRFRAKLSKLGPRSLAASIAMPGKVVAASAVLALAGWVAGTKTEIVSDFHELLPASLPELQDVGALEDETGVSGEVSVASPPTI